MRVRCANVHAAAPHVYVLVELGRGGVLPTLGGYVTWMQVAGRGRDQGAGDACARGRWADEPSMRTDGSADFHPRLVVGGSGVLAIGPSGSRPGLRGQKLLVFVLPKLNL
jgi:hypothetical protein